MANYPELKLHIAGEWRHADGQPVINPADEFVKLLSLCGGALRFQIDQWRAVKTIQAAHMQRRAADRHQIDDRGCDRIRPHRRAQGEASSRLAGTERCLQHQVATRPMHPVKHLDALCVRCPSARCASAHRPLSNRSAHPGCRAWDTRHACATVYGSMPIKYTPASVRRGKRDRHFPRTQVLIGRWRFLFIARRCGQRRTKSMATGRRHVQRTRRLLTTRR